VLYRPKMGFAVPLKRWFRAPLREQVRSALLDGALARTGYFERSYLQHLVDAHASGARDYSAPLWTLLMFDSFLRTVVDGSQAARASRSGACSNSMPSARPRTSGLDTRPPSSRSRCRRGPSDP